MTIFQRPQKEGSIINSHKLGVFKAFLVAYQVGIEFDWEATNVPGVES